MRTSRGGKTEGARVNRDDWADSERRWRGESGVKSHGLTVELHSKLPCLSIGEGSGIPSVGVKCVDIWKNTGGEGGHLDEN